MQPDGWVNFGQAVIKEWSTKRAMQLAAALAFFSVFSLAPLLVVAVLIAGALFGEQAAAGKLASTMSQVVGQRGAEMAQTVLASTEAAKGGAIATILSVGILLFGASLVFSQLKDALDQIWEVGPAPGAGWQKRVRDRLAGMALVGAVALGLVVLVIFDAVLAGLGSRLDDFLPVGPLFYRVLANAAIFVTATVGLAAVFKYLPDVKLSWSAVWPGAILTGVLLFALKVGFGYYLGYSTVGSVYGAASSLAVVLVWIYFSAMSLFLGAAVTQVYARHRGEGMEPGEDAVRIEPAHPVETSRR